MESGAVAAQRQTVQKLNAADFTVRANKAALFTILYGVKCKISKHRQVKLPTELVAGGKTTMSFAEACAQLQVPLAGVTGILTCAMSIVSGGNDEKLVHARAKEGIISASSAHPGLIDAN
eukprot:3594865-Amphidinium_carterae.1